MFLIRRGTTRDDNPDPNPDQTSDLSNVFTGVEGVTATLPVWYYQKDVKYDPGVFRCNMRCHGVVMSTCFYITDRSLDREMNQPRLNRQGGTWCAGGEAQQPGIIFGSAPPEIKRFLADLGKALVPAGVDRATPPPATADRRAAARPIASR